MHETLLFYFFLSRNQRGKRLLDYFFGYHMDTFTHAHACMRTHTHTLNASEILWWHCELFFFSGKLRNAWEYGKDLRTCKTICNLDLELTSRTTVYFVDIVQLPHSPASVRVHTHKHAQTLAPATVISQEDTSFPSCWEAGLYVCWVVTLLPVQQDITEMPQQQTGPECKQSFEDSGNH